MIGAEVGGFRIESMLGAGSMGVIYVARQRSPERRVALKLIAPAYAHDGSFRRRFLREVSAAAAIEHPHILPVYEAGEDDGTLYMAMRLIEGSDLREILARDSTLSPERTVLIGGQVADALDTAHDRGLVHRDVKPGNILVSTGTTGDFASLSDFGLSTWTATTNATLETTGRMVGTANYVAPEQIEGARVDRRADIYSLGCVIFECLTGRPPFDGGPPATILHAHLHRSPPAASSVNPGLPGQVDQVLARALAKDPADRPASCGELVGELRAAFAGRPVTARTEPPVEPAAARRPRWPAVLAAVTLVALALLAGILTGSATRTAQPDGPTSPSEPPKTPAARDVIRDGVQVTASQTAPSSEDGAGNIVTYVPANVIDGDIRTAWRTPGDGVGQTVTLIFDNPVDVSRIGLVPGYAKTDPITGVDRFRQHRIVVEARFLIPGLPPITKTYRPEPVPQFVRIGATTRRVTIEVTETTEPGGLDFTAISEIYVVGSPQ
jgi:serine/threonine-protein kinase